MKNKEVVSSGSIDRERIRTSRIPPALPLPWILYAIVEEAETQRGAMESANEDETDHITLSIFPILEGTERREHSCLIIAKCRLLVEIHQSLPPDTCVTTMKILLQTNSKVNMAAANAPTHNLRTLIYDTLLPTIVVYFFVTIHIK